MWSKLLRLPSETLYPRTLASFVSWSLFPPALISSPLHDLQFLTAFLYPCPSDLESVCGDSQCLSFSLDATPSQKPSWIHNPKTGLVAPPNAPTTLCTYVPQWWFSPLCVITSCLFCLHHMLRLELLESRPWSFLYPLCLTQGLAPSRNSVNIC